MISRAINKLRDALDIARLARAVHILARRCDSLSLLARELEDRAEIAETVSEEYRRLLEVATADKVTAQKAREELATALSHARAAAEQAEWKAGAEQRKRRNAVAALEAMRAELMVAGKVLR